MALEYAPRRRPTVVRPPLAEDVMKRVRGCAMAAMAAAVWGCSGSASDDGFGQDPDFGTLDARLSTPTGTIAPSAVSRSVDAVEALRTPAVSIVALSRVTPSKTDCAALAHGDAIGSCACPRGGQLEYDFSEIVSARA